MKRPDLPRGFWPWLALFAASVVLHLYMLDARAFHSDESIHAKLAFDLLHQGTYRYDPTYHGPLLYYLTALSYAMFGDSDFTARLPIAACGILMLVLAMKLRRPFGGRAAWFTGLLFTISPLYLYYGRFLRMDILELFTASACFLCAYRAWLSGDRRHWLWAAFWAGLAFATKENAYITLFLAAATAVLLMQAYGRSLHPAAVVRGMMHHRHTLLPVVSIFVLVTVPLYTLLLSQPGDWPFPLKAIRYWTGQHHVARLDGPWWFHIFRLLVYEFLILAAALAWILRRRKLRPIEVALFLFGCSSLVMYAYLGEKVPWLGVHQVWAFLPLAGAQLARTFGPAGSRWGRGAAAAALAATCVVSFNANFVNVLSPPDSGRIEALTFAETAPQMLSVVRRHQPVQNRPRISVLVSGNATWPLAWYWRHGGVRWNSKDEHGKPRLVVANPIRRGELEAALGDGYVYEEVPLRFWWFPERRTPSLQELVRYVLWRTPWIRPVVSTTLVAAQKDTP